MLTQGLTDQQGKWELDRVPSLRLWLRCLEPFRHLPNVSRNFVVSFFLWLLFEFSWPVFYKTYSILHHCMTCRSCHSPASPLHRPLSFSNRGWCNSLDNLGLSLCFRPLTLDYWYHLSYMWYGLLGMVVGMVVGIVASLVTGTVAPVASCRAFFCFKMKVYIWLCFKHVTHLNLIGPVRCST